MSQLPVCSGEQAVKAFATWLSGDHRLASATIGTRDWKQYSAVCLVSPKTRSMAWGLTRNGRGKIWIDLDTVQVERADGTPK